MKGKKTQVSCQNIEQNGSVLIENCVPIMACMLSVVIPAKNEEHRLSRTIVKLNETLNWLNISYEIIVVNDGSTDQTAKVAQLEGAYVVNNSGDNGIAAAFRLGAKFSNGAVIMLCPADIDDFEFLEEAMFASRQFEVVSVSKRHPKSIVIGYSRWRWFLSNTYQILVNILFMTSGFCTDTHYIKLYNGPILKTFLDKCSINGPVGETELMLYARDFGCSFTEVPAKIIHNFNNSKTSKKLIIRTLRELLTLRLRRSRFFQRSEF